MRLSNPAGRTPADIDECASDEQVETVSVKTAQAGHCDASPVWTLSTALTAPDDQGHLSLVSKVALDPVHSSFPSAISLCLSFLSLTLSGASAATVKPASKTIIRLLVTAFTIKYLLVNRFEPKNQGESSYGEICTK